MTPFMGAFFLRTSASSARRRRERVNPVHSLPLAFLRVRIRSLRFPLRSRRHCVEWTPSLSKTRRLRPKFLTGSDGILLIRQEILQSSISNYWQQREQRIGLGLQRSGLWHLLKAWGGVFRFQPIGHACSTG